jgi:hypothetical protein
LLHGRDDEDTEDELEHQISLLISI